VGIGEEGVTIEKCRSHVSQATRAKLAAEERDIAQGNDEADALAKQGAALGLLECYRAQAVEAAGEKVKGALQFIGAFGVAARVDGLWPDTTPWPPKAERLLGSDGMVLRRAARPPPTRPHVLPLEVLDNGAVRCRLCQLQASGARAKVFRCSECPGRVAARIPGRLAQSRLASVHGHSLMLSEPYVWCLKCGSHTRKRVGKLAALCRPDPKSRRYRTCRRRLLQGADPVTGVLLPGGQPRRVTVDEVRCWREARGTS
jgi:hypothetical protein